MSAVSSGSQPKIRVDRTEIDVSPLASGPVREEILIMNEGKGRLYGNIRSDAPWVTVLDTNLNTPLVQRIILQIRPEKAPSGGESWVHILSTGGIARVKVKLKRSPVPVSTLKLDEKNFQFCGITKDEILTFSLTIRNSGPGFLSGTAYRSMTGSRFRSGVYDKNCAGHPNCVHCPKHLRQDIRFGEFRSGQWRGRNG
jgi:hypothetical protein